MERGVIRDREDFQGQVDEDILSDAVEQDQDVALVAIGALRDAVGD